MGGIMSDDSQLQRAVLAEFQWEPSVSPAHIGVSVSDGIVSLTGHVESFAEKHAAETAARRVKGVKAVVEKLDVWLPFDKKRGDEEIASEAIDRLGWDVTVPVDTVKVKVERGWVTLTGQVESHFQREAAEEDIHRLNGVIGVSNHISILSKPDTATIKDDIMLALGRSSFLDIRTIGVSADGGKVRLTGTVQSLRDRQVAAATAWTAAGTISVENDIAVI
jgi:osmotically-inducible protein OsmY